MQIITIGRGSKPLKIILEEPDESIYITTPQELKELIDGVKPFDDANAKISLDLIKDTQIGVISV